MTAPSTPSALNNKPNLNETLASWKGPSHPFKKRDKTYYQAIAALTLLLVIIVYFLFQDILFIGAILSVTVLIVVVSKVPPIEIEHKITPIGIENAGRLFRWIELYAFWFEERWGDTLLVVHTRLPFPSQVRIVIVKEDEKKLQDILGKYLLYLEKPPKSVMDSLSHWLSRKFPLEPSK